MVLYADIVVQILPMMRSTTSTRLSSTAGVSTRTSTALGLAGSGRTTSSGQTSPSQ